MAFPGSDKQDVDYGALWLQSVPIGGNRVARKRRFWAERERLHRGDELVWLLDERLERESLENGPYFFSDLADATAGDEQAAIDAGAIKATRIDRAGSRRNRARERATAQETANL
jgi:hypothetical protein